LKSSSHQLRHIRIVAHAGDVLAANINLQTRSTVRQVHERGLAHHRGRRGNPSGDARAEFYSTELFAVFESMQAKAICLATCG